ncbi:hypothetical protein NDU88_006825 [Pleurodeles waltl]|uniref:Uncharacterized protein n=1 Tax=Pleurodeles waltl TaxID=8319 RepID=A0AAV7PMI3_PLEWA|nr:hypothetical protein NDU88_006825 [Pleurodeles waltl]
MRGLRESSGGQAQVVLGVVKKEMRLACATIEKDMVSLKATVLASNYSEDHEHLRLRQSELIALAENQARQYAIAVQRRLYYVGDKAGKLLAWLAWRDRERTWVLRVENSDRVTQTTGVAIAETFADY